jgi:hypothetical protein
MITKAIDLINPEVMADVISAKLENAIKFAPYAKVDNTLVGRPGDTITRPKYAYIGPAVDLTEGVAMTPEKMSMTSTTVTVKEAGKAVDLGETAIITNVDDVVGQTNDQLAKAIADKVDIDYLATLDETLLQFDGTATTAANIIDAIALFGDEDEEAYVLFINPADYNELYKSMVVGNSFLSKAQLAELLGLADIVKTQRVAEGTSYIQKQGAVEIVYKKKPEIKVAEDILTRSVTLAINSFYTTNLFNDNGVVKLEAIV